MFQKFIIVAAWASAAVFAYATLTHVGFVYSIYYKLAPLLMWPAMKSYAHVEHVIAFAILGALFSLASQPHHFRLLRCLFERCHSRRPADFDA
jgi:hypothetical protein